MLLFARIPTVFRLRCHYQKGIKRGSVTPVNRGQKSVVRGRIWPNVKKVPNGRLQGLPSSPRLRRDETARQATQEPPSHKTTARQRNQLRFGPACARKNP